MPRIIEERTETHIHDTAGLLASRGCRAAGTREKFYCIPRPRLGQSGLLRPSESSRACGFGLRLDGTATRR
jgi:hypothetical protein